MENILHNWEACMDCGPLKERKEKLWSSPALGFLKLQYNVDGAAWDKLGPADIGVPRNYKGEITNMFSRLVGVIKNSMKQSCQQFWKC